MFTRTHMTVVDWWIFFLLMAIPIVNIVVFVLLLLSSGTNKSLKNYLLALILPLVITIVLFVLFGASLGFMDSL